MISADISYRIPFADTDQMGVVYYANYLRYFEMARAELLRSIHFSYTELEHIGCGLPVLEAHCFYHRPAKFEDLITVRASLLEVKGIRSKVGCQVFCNDVLLADGYTLHAFVNPEGRPIRPPAAFLKAIAKADTLAEQPDI